MTGFGAQHHFNRGGVIKKRLIWGAVWAGVALLLGIILGTAVLFYKHVSPPRIPEEAASYQGIVVFTGGQGRVQAGFDALQVFPKAQYLLISGVNPSTSFEAVLNIGDPQKLAQMHQDRVELDYLSQTTFGNIEQTKLWAKRHGLKKIVVVTSDYHAPRVRLLFQAHLPETAFVLYPVASEHATFWVWLLEFAKYMAVKLDLFAGGLVFAS